MKRHLPAALAVLATLLAAGAALAVDDTVRDTRAVRPPLEPLRVIPGHARFDQDTANANSVAMTVTNYGFYGNNFFNRSPSLEYPAGRGYEHLVRGGLWIGARAQDTSGAFTGVVTGTVDANQGPTSPEGSEFTPSTRSSVKRSTQPVSPYFDRTAVSEFDIVSDFDDYSPTIAAANTEPHRSMRLQVRQETFQWNFAEFRNILFMRITIKNTGPVLRDVYVGIYNEFASGRKSAYTNWPPSSGDPTGDGSWFNNKWFEYDPADSLLREHYCDQMATYGDVTNCILSRAPYWIGLRYLGHKTLAEDTTAKNLTVAAWSWAPGSLFRDTDAERYALMSAGTIQPLDGDSLRPGTGDPVAILTVGPFPVIYNDSTVTVNFAYVGGADVPTIRSNSDFAQFAFDRDYVLPRPPDAPRVKVVPSSNAATIYWDNTPELSFDVTSRPSPNDFEGYRIYAGEDPDTLARVAQFDLDTSINDNDTTGFNTGLGAIRLDPPVVLDGQTYHYSFKVTGLKNGFRTFLGVTGYDLGNSQISPLESGLSAINRVGSISGPSPGERSGDPVVFPNPYRVEARWDAGPDKNVRDHYLWFTNLPERCTVRIYTLSGDLVYETDFNGATYAGEGTRGVFDPAKSLGKPALSGTTMAWNMITREGQAIATGLYLFSVENKAGGETKRGRFLVVKSDRE